MRPALPYVVGLIAAILPFISGGRGPLAQFLVIALSSAVALLFLRESEKTFASPALIALIILPIAAAVSLITSPVPGTTLSKTLLFAGYGVLLWVTMQFSLAEARKIAGALMISGIVLIGFGLWAFYLADRSFNVPLSSTYYNANGFAGFLLIFMILAASRAWTSGVLRSRILFGALAAVSLGAILMTGSRGALAGLAGAGLFAVIAVIRRLRAQAWSRKQLSAAALVTGLVVVAGAAVIVFSPINGRVSAALQDEPRLDYWSGAIELGAGSPLIGTGAGSFARLYPEVQSKVLGFSRDPHSRLFEAFAETGIFGLAAVLLFFVSVLWVAWKGILAASDDEFPVVLGPLVAAVGFLAHGSVDLQWSFPATVVIFIVLLGIGSRPVARQVSFPSATRSGVAVLVVIVALAGTAEYLASVQVEGGLLSASLRKYDEAEAQFVMAARLNPLSPDPHYYLGFNHSQPLKEFSSSRSLARLNTARREVRLAQKLDPRSPLLYSLAAELDRKEASATTGGRKIILTKSIERNLERALAADEWNHPDIELEYATLLEDEGATDQARMLYEDITEKYSVKTLNVMRAWFNGGLSRSQIIEQTESDPGLREQLNAYFTYADASVTAHYRLALLSRSGGETGLARKHVETALILDPEHVLAKKLLASLGKARN